MRGVGGVWGGFGLWVRDVARLRIVVELRVVGVGGKNGGGGEGGLVDSGEGRSRVLPQETGGGGRGEGRVLWSRAEGVLVIWGGVGKSGIPGGLMERMRKGGGGLLEGRKGAVGKVEGRGGRGGDRLRKGSWRQVLESYIFHLSSISFCSVCCPTPQSFLDAVTHAPPPPNLLLQSWFLYTWH